MEESSKSTGSDDAKSPADMLRALFAMQSDLNDYVFSKNEIRASNGSELTMGAISEAALNGRLGVNDLPNQWLQRYAEAMCSELNELQSDLLWKWWSKDRIDLQNIRVELIDILHFLISAMISAGLTPERVFEIYQQKHAVNFNRQNSGYSQATKTEDDNRNIK
ncbi:MAG: dUTPase [Planctomycetaceae bacterium]|nr:dUTPase [Planctomycetaceae bacterium]